MRTVLVTIPVDEATTEVLVDTRRLAAVSELVVVVVKPTNDNEPLDQLLETMKRKPRPANRAASTSVVANLTGQ